MYGRVSSKSEEVGERLASTIGREDSCERK